LTGEIIIRPLEGSLDLPDGAVSLGAYSISGDASLSAFERIMVVYKLGLALSFDAEAWEMLMAMAMHEAPFDNLIEIEWPGAPQEDGHGG